MYMEKYRNISQLIEEAQANFTLYQNCGDGNALERYTELMNKVKLLKDE
jgi:hypothetical protein